jgi:hypothetical protein
MKARWPEWRDHFFVPIEDRVDRRLDPAPVVGPDRQNRARPGDASRLGVEPRAVEPVKRGGHRDEIGAAIAE